MNHPETETKLPQSSATSLESRPVNALPSPEDYPNADVVIYDGMCVFCQKQVANLLKFDGKQRLAFVSLHSEFVKENFPDLTFEQMMKQMYIIPNSDSGFSSKRYGGAEGIRYLTRRLPKLWIFSPLTHIPFTMGIQQWCYQQIAKRRYKISGKDESECDESGTCKLHFSDSQTPGS